VVHDLDQLLQTAELAARAAGERLREGLRDYRRVNAEPGRDVKLEADVASEALIRDLLGATGLPVIGEEEGGDAALVDGDATYWVVDPLDGTYNYLRELPQTCVSIGLMRGAEPVLGVIHDFNRPETFSGIVARGEFRIDAQPCSPRWAGSLAKAALATGFPASADLGDAALQHFFSQVRAYRKVRMLGSAALAVAYVAAGRVDAYYEQGVRLWDIAAGLALVKAAGGVVRWSPTPGGPALAYDVWAAGRPDLIA